MFGIFAYLIGVLAKSNQKVFYILPTSYTTSATAATTAITTTDPVIK
jgi:hypothetical protein